MSRHVCKRFDYHRGRRRCTYCRKLQWLVQRPSGGTYENEMTLDHFANNWLPAISGTEPRKMLNVEVAFPFEWNCYESWNVVWRVRFEFPEHDERMATRVHIMNGWLSKWQECFNRIDAEAQQEFEERTGQPYRIGDNSYEEMRRFIQS